MLAQRTRYGWVLRIDAGEELFETLRAFAVQHDVLYNIPTACNRATAEFLVSSPLFHGEYDRLVEDFTKTREAFVRRFDA